MTNRSKPKLQVIIASTRPGRVGLPVGTWFEQCAIDHSAFEVEVADLAEIDLPFLDEPNHPSQQRYTKQHTKDWSARITASDAFVVVMPAYRTDSFRRRSRTRSTFWSRSGGSNRSGSVSSGGSRAGSGQCRRSSRS